MPVLYRQGLAATPFPTRRPPHSGPFSPGPAANGLLWGRRLRPHFPELTELLEDYYDRAAESCPQFVNMSEMDKYSVTCTVCRHFDAGGCTSPNTTTPNIIELLQRARQHDNL